MLFSVMSRLKNTQACLFLLLYFKQSQDWILFFQRLLDQIPHQPTSSFWSYRAVRTDDGGRRRCRHCRAIDRTLPSFCPCQGSRGAFSGCSRRDVFASLSSSWKWNDTKLATAAERTKRYTFFLSLSLSLPPRFILYSLSLFLFFGPYLLTRWKDQTIS